MVMAGNAAQTRQPATRRRTTAVKPDAVRDEARDKERETAQTTQETRERREPEGAPLVRWGHVSVPVPVGVHVPAPHLPELHVRASAQNAAKRTAFGLGVVRANLPRPRQMVYYGALGGLAAVGAIEWPVAAAIGAGVWVATRSGWRRRAETAEVPAQHHEPAAQPPTKQTVAARSTAARSTAARSTAARSMAAKSTAARPTRKR
jgi:hypothetical protein